MAHALELRNPIRDYAWGSSTLLAEILGLPNPSGEPQAEVWLGAHPVASSQVEIAGEWRSLLDWISSAPESVLGARVADRFGGQLPFLLKVLAAAEPLSLQAHPGVEHAERGFERENAQGLALDDPLRSFRDPRPKPELLCALTAFEALVGFREVAEICRNFRQLDVSDLSVPLRNLETGGDPAALRGFFEFLFTSDSLDRPALIDAALRIGDEFEELEPMQRLAEVHPGDAGMLAPLLLNYVKLEPGDAIFLPAGRLHAYLGGCGVEIMGNSDNVLRAGLTQKHLDMRGLLEVLDFAAGPPDVIRPRMQAAGAFLYPTPAQEFELSRIEVCDAWTCTRSQDDSAEILLCVEGQLRLLAGADEIAQILLERGSSVFVPAQSNPYRLIGSGRVFRASVPR